MIRDGQLPPGDRCMICGVTTSDALDVHVQCESAWVKGPGNTRFLLVALGILFFPFWILWVFLGRELLGEERKELGCERSACAPLRICANTETNYAANGRPQRSKSCCLRFSSIANCSPSFRRQKSRSKNRRGLAHFAMPGEQNVPVPLSSAGSWIDSKSRTELGNSGSGQKEAAVNRLHQIVLIASIVLGSWLGMEAVHESGHALGRC